jgi:hypothetical protein
MTGSRIRARIKELQAKVNLQQRNKNELRSTMTSDENFIGEASSRLFTSSSSIGDNEDHDMAILTLSTNTVHPSSHQ